MNYSKEINGKNILITGGTGSFGNQMIEELSNYKPKSVVIYSRDEDKQHNMKENLKDRRMNDMTDKVIIWFEINFMFIIKIKTAIKQNFTNVI